MMVYVCHVNVMAQYDKQTNICKGEITLERE